MSKSRQNTTEEQEVKNVLQSIVNQVVTNNSNNNDLPEAQSPLEDIFFLVLIVAAEQLILGAHTSN